jgi:hypothetical protein
MTRAEFYRELECAVEMPPSSIHGGESLKDLEGWGSMAMVIFIAMADEKLGAAPSATDLGRCKTVADLVALFPDKITAY